MDNTHNKMGKKSFSKIIHHKQKKIINKHKHIRIVCVSYFNWYQYMAKYT